MPWRYTARELRPAVRRGLAGYRRVRHARQCLTRSVQQRRVVLPQVVEAGTKGLEVRLGGDVEVDAEGWGSGPTADVECSRPGAAAHLLPHARRTARLPGLRQSTDPSRAAVGLFSINRPLL